MKDVKTFEIRKISLETREAEGLKTIKGFIPFNSLSQNLGGFREIIDNTAFNRTLASGADVKALISHNEEKVIGSTASGSLRLTLTEDGLLTECDLPDTTYASDLFTIIQRGDITNLSFGFICNEDYYDVNQVRHLKDITLYEISYGVAWGAYANTYSSVLLRSAFQKRNINLDDVISIIEKQSNGETLSPDELAKAKEIAGAIYRDEPKATENTSSGDNTLEAEKIKLWLSLQKEKINE